MWLISALRPLFMPPTLENLNGHIALGLSVRVSIQNLLRYSFDISYMDSSSKSN